MPHNLHLNSNDPVIIGSDFRVKATLKDEAGVAILGAIVDLTLKIQKPDGTAASSTVLVEDGLGVYSYVYLTADAGRHQVQVTYAGSFKRLVEAFFMVKPEKVIV